MIKKLLAIILTLSIFIPGAAFAASEVNINSGDVRFVSADYGDLNILTVKDGNRIAVNGGFAFSFYSSTETVAQMEISMVGLSANRQALVFFNETAEGEKITSQNAPNMAKAVSGGTIPLKSTADVYNLTSEDFDKYTYNVNIKRGVNTVYVPSSNLSNDCCGAVYSVGGVTSNSGVCYESIAFTAANWDGYKIYVIDIPSQYLLAHDSGQILEGYDTEDDTTNRTQHQSYPSMYTVVPFQVGTAGDYRIDVNYNAWTYDNITDKYPAAVYVDADLSSIKNDDWQKFLDTETYPSTTWSTITDESLKTITQNGAIKPVDLGYWRSSLPQEIDGAYPFYYVKSFVLEDLTAGEHTLLFYTADNILDSADSTVNKNVLFNSFEFTRLKDEASNLDITVQKYVSSSEDRVGQVPESYAKAIEFYDTRTSSKSLIVPVTVFNNTTKTETGTVFVALYKNGRIADVKTTSFSLEPNTSHEENVTIPITAEADSVSIYVWEDGTMKPYLKNFDLFGGVVPMQLIANGTASHYVTTATSGQPFVNYENGEEIANEAAIETFSKQTYDGVQTSLIKLSRTPIYHVKAPVAGTYNLKFIGSGTTDGGWLAYKVNGGTQSANIDGVGTAGWDTVTELDLGTIILNAGVNTIQFIGPEQTAVRGIKLTGINNTNSDGSIVTPSGVTPIELLANKTATHYVTATTTNQPFVNYENGEEIANEAAIDTSSKQTYGGVQTSLIKLSRSPMYYVNAPLEGEYNIRFVGSGITDGGNFVYKVNGGSNSTSYTVGTAGWDTVKEIDAGNVTLNAGVNTIQFIGPEQTAVRGLKITGVNNTNPDGSIAVPVGVTPIELSANSTVAHYVTSTTTNQPFVGYVGTAVAANADIIGTFSNKTYDGVVTSLIQFARSPMYYVNAPVAGNYTLKFIGSGRSDGGWFNYKVNGGSDSQVYSVGVAGWDTVKEIDAGTITLNAGINTIQFTGPGNTAVRALKLTGPNASN